LSTDVPRFAWLSALSVFGLFALLLFGASLGRELMVRYVGPFSIGVWLVLLIHLLPATLGCIYLLRSRPPQDIQKDDNR